MKIKEVNIGKEIYEKWKISGKTKASLADTIGIYRQNIDKSHFDRESLPSNVIAKASDALNFNFFSLFYDESLGDFSETTDNGSSEASGNPKVPVSGHDVRLYLNEISHLKDKIEMYKAQLEDKEQLISVLKEVLSKK